MPTAVEQDWSPETYARFRGLRLRPALDLLAQVGDLPGGDIVDLGCGDGAAAAALRAAHPGRRLVGVDASPAMLDRAQGHDARVLADIADWQADGPVALIFSNAALHWLDDHAGLMPRLVRMLVPGGVLAVQMPRQYFAPSHRFLRDIAATMFPDRFDFTRWEAPVQRAEAYVDLLAPLGTVSAWQTDYIQTLPATDGHPVRRFTESTAMRPFLARLSAAEAETFTAAYEAALTAAYPARADGSVLFAFSRVFFTVRT